LRDAHAWSRAAICRFDFARADRWEAGEIEYRYQHKRIASAILDCLILKKQSIVRLMAKEPRTPDIQAATDEAFEDLSSWAELNNRITRLTEEANSKGVERFAGVDLDTIASFSDGWAVPDRYVGGVQAIAKACCSCGAVHIYEYRVSKAGLVEYRSYSMENENAEASRADGIGRAETCAGGEAPAARCRSDRRGPPGVGGKQSQAAPGCPA
jgi:hypothetical protein